MAIQSVFVISDQTSALAELCGGLKPLAASVTAVMFGDEALAKEAASCGADKLIYCTVDGDAAPEDYAKAIAAEVKKAPGAFVVPHNSIRGRCLAGKLGVYLDCAVLTTVSELTAEGDGVVCHRMVYGGTAQSSVAFTTPYAVITMNGGVFGDVPALPATTDIAAISGAPEGTLKRVARNEKTETAVNLAVAKRIVDVGRGLAAEEDLEMMRKLASALEAEVGCSRPVAENNKWLPKAVYMGVTGVQVKPELCMSIGVSGQVQHIAGINKSRVIVAINKDKDAPIFKNADFGVVGDLYKVVPALIEKLS